MEHDGHAGHDGSHGLLISNVALDESHLRERLEVPEVPGVKVVEDNHIMAFLDENSHNVRPDESRPSCHECVHASIDLPGFPVTARGGPSTLPAVALSVRRAPEEFPEPLANRGGIVVPLGDVQRSSPQFLSKLFVAGEPQNRLLQIAGRAL